MNDTMHPSDVLVGIGNFLPEGRKCFRHDDAAKFHTFFYERREKYPDIFGRFTFKWDSTFPDSPELREAVSSLASTGLLQFCLTDPGHYQFDSEIADSYKRSVKPRTDEGQERGLVEIAADFDKAFGEPNRYGV